MNYYHLPYYGLALSGQTDLYSGEFLWAAFHSLKYRWGETLHIEDEEPAAYNKKVGSSVVLYNEVFTVYVTMLAPWGGHCVLILTKPGIYALNTAGSKSWG